MKQDMEGGETETQEIFFSMRGIRIGEESSNSTSLLLVKARRRGRGMCYIN